MKIKLVIFVLFFCGEAFSQNVQVEWVKSFREAFAFVGGWNGDRATDIAVDSEGNVLSIGQFQHGIDLDPGPDSTIYNSFISDVYISKLNSDGQYVWSGTFTGNSYIDAYQLKLDANDNIYITGYFEGPIDFDPGLGSTILTPSTFSVMFIVKLNSAGSLQWVHSFEPLYPYQKFPLVVDSESNVLISGSFTNTIDFDPGPDVFELTSTSGYEQFLLKLDTDGQFVWAKHYGDYGLPVCVALDLDEFGHIYKTGNFTEFTNFHPGDEELFLTYVENEANSFIGKYSEQGLPIWVKKIEASTEYLEIDPQGNILIAGVYKGIVDFDPGPEIHELDSASSLRCFVLKLDSDGNFLWVKDIGGRFGFLPNPMTIDPSGNIFLVGNFNDSLAFSLGFDESYLVSYGSRDIFTIKLSNNGELLWAVNHGGLDYDSGNAITADSNGNIYVTGTFYDTAYFNPGAVPIMITNGGPDQFVVKLKGINTSTSEISQNRLSVFPNPSSNQITVLFPAISNSLSVQIFDLNGKLHFSKSYSSTSQVEIDTSKLSSGTYVIQAISDSEVFRSKFVRY